MSGRLRLRALACLGMLGILGLALLPPEHVHLAAHHDAHAGPEVVHRHFEPHPAVRLPTHVENPDNDPTYLTSAFTVPGHESVVGPCNTWLEIGEPQASAPRPTQWHRRTHDLRVHDPPWACAQGLRGPPSQLA